MHCYKYIAISYNALLNHCTLYASSGWAMLFILFEQFVFVFCSSFFYFIFFSNFWVSGAACPLGQSPTNLYMNICIRKAEISTSFYWNIDQLIFLKAEISTSKKTNFVRSENINVLSIDKFVRSDIL